MSPKELKALAAKIWMDAQPYRRELQEIYQYYMPFRQTTIETANEGGGRSEGQPIADMLFDATGLSAAFTFAGTLQADWMPLNQPFMAIEAGPLIPDDDARKALNEQLQKVTDIVHAVLSVPLPTVVHEMCFDLFAGTGAKLLLKGDDSMPIRALAVPSIELGLRNGPWGQVWHIVWKRKWPAGDLPVMWPKATFSDELSKKINDDKTALIEIVQYTYYDASAKRWRLCVYADRDAESAIIAEDDFRTCPWVISRFFCLPGEAFGRGLGHLGLPFVKTANKSRELALTAAAFAIMGIFTRRNDGVFNPDTATFEPLAFWNVASNGGPLGPTVQRLPIPQDFDVSSIVMQDERDQIRRVLMDDELPDEQLAVRSATEVAGRLKRYARRYGGVNARLGVEWIVPTTRRSVDLLEDASLLPMKGTNITIDQLLTKVAVRAPAMAAQRADRVEQAVNWMQIITMMLGPQAALLTAKVEELLPEMGRWIGVEERFIRSKAEQKELKDMIGQIIAAQQKFEAVPQQQPQPGAQYVNGGAL